MNRRILALAIPAIISNITTPLLSLADTAIVGHLGSAVPLAAIAVGGAAFNLLYWLFAFLRMGTSGLTAQAYGAKDVTTQRVVLKKALTVATIAGLMMIVLGWPIAAGVLWFMDVNGDTYAMAQQYILILIWGAPASLGNYALAGWFLGMQDSRTPMWISIIINVVNIPVSVALVYGAGWGVAGCAIGSLVAQWLGFLIALWRATNKERGRLARATTKERGRLARATTNITWRAFFSINFDIFLRTACLVAVTLWFTRVGATQGVIILAVNALLMQLFVLFSYTMDGFAFAGEALVGRFVGANDGRSLRKCIKALLGWGFLWALLFTILYAVGGEAFLRLLSNDEDVITASREFFYWGVTVPMAGFLAFTWDGVFIGATMTRRMLVAMASGMAVFFAVYLALFPAWGNHALWLALILYLLTRGIAQSFLVQSLYRRLPSTNN
ncbi:MAG: MATE family efflux transporter [Bacteroidales bacterium]|nr:MATE family efflux transporter [Bacteroidales bacterium]